MLTPRSFRRVKDEAGSGRKTFSDLRVGTRGLSVGDSDTQGAARGISFGSHGSFQSHRHRHRQDHLIRESDSDETLDHDRNSLVVVSDTDSEDLYHEIAKFDPKRSRQSGPELASDSDGEGDPSTGAQYLGEGAFEILRELTLSRAENEELKREIDVLQLQLSGLRSHEMIDEEIQADTHECEHVELLNRARIELEQCQQREAQWERICEKLKWELKSERENVKELRKMMDMIQFGYRLARERGAIPKGIEIPMVPIPQGHVFEHEELVENGRHWAPQVPHPPDSFDRRNTDAVNISQLGDPGFRYEQTTPVSSLPEHAPGSSYGIVPYGKEPSTYSRATREDAENIDELRISATSSVSASVDDGHSGNRSSAPLPLSSPQGGGTLPRVAPHGLSPPHGAERRGSWPRVLPLSPPTSPVFQNTQDPQPGSPLQVGLPRPLPERRRDHPGLLPVPLSPHSLNGDADGPPWRADVKPPPPSEEAAPSVSPRSEASSALRSQPGPSPALAHSFPTFPHARLPPPEAPLAHAALPRLDSSADDLPAPGPLQFQHFHDTHPAGGHVHPHGELDFVDADLDSASAAAARPGSEASSAHVTSHVLRAGSPAGSRDLSLGSGSPGLGPSASVSQAADGSFDAGGDRDPGSAAPSPSWRPPLPDFATWLELRTNSGPGPPQWEPPPPNPQPAAPRVAPRAADSDLGYTPLAHPAGRTHESELELEAAAPLPPDARDHSRDPLEAPPPPAPPPAARALSDPGALPARSPDRPAPPRPNRQLHMGPGPGPAAAPQAREAPPAPSAGTAAPEAEQPGAPPAPAPPQSLPRPLPNFRAQDAGTRREAIKAFEHSLAGVTAQQSPPLRVVPAHRDRAAPPPETRGAGTAGTGHGVGPSGGGVSGARGRGDSDGPRDEASQHRGSREQAARGEQRGQQPHWEGPSAPLTRARGPEALRAEAGGARGGGSEGESSVAATPRSEEEGEGEGEAATPLRLEERMADAEGGGLGVAAAAREWNAAWGPGSGGGQQPGGVM